MRFAVFIFSFYLIFGQIYSAYAAFPLLGGAVAVARGVGTLVKAGRVAKGGKVLAGAVGAWCLANKKTCKELAGEAFEKLFPDDDENATCRYRFAINTNDTPKSASATYSEILSRLSEQNSSLEYKHHPKHNEQINTFIREHKERVRENPSSVNKDDIWLPVTIDNTYYFWRSKYSEDETYFESPHSIVMFANCHEGDIDNSYSPDEEEKKKREKELYDALKDKLSDDDITNIVNNYGDDIDIDKYCASGATCYFIDSDFEKEVNNNDYDIDKIDDKNCNMRNGKIVSCPSAKKKKDDDDDDGETSDKDKDDTRKDDDDKNGDKLKKDKDIDLPNISSFNLPEFCTWAKWLCDEPQLKSEQAPTKEVPLKNPSEFDKSYINTGSQCPADVVKSFNTRFAVNEIRFEMRPICDFASINMRPVIIFISYIWAAIYIGGAFKVGD